MENQTRLKIGREPEVLANYKTLLLALLYCIKQTNKQTKKPPTLFPEGNVANIPL